VSHSKATATISWEWNIGQLEPPRQRLVLDVYLADLFTRVDMPELRTNRPNRDCSGWPGRLGVKAV
jgi:hypothetical protein